MYTGFWWGIPDAGRPLRKPKRVWENNTKMDCQEIECGGMDWTHLVQDRVKLRALVKTVMPLRVLQNKGNLLTG